MGVAKIPITTSTTPIGTNANGFSREEMIQILSCLPEDTRIIRITESEKPSEEIAMRWDIYVENPMFNEGSEILMKHRTEYGRDEYGNEMKFSSFQGLDLNDALDDINGAQ